MKGGSLAAFGLIALSLASAGQSQSSSTVNSMDKTFITKAAQGGMAEVKLGKLASQKGQASSVRSFGDKMVEDHTAANDKLSGIVKGLGITPPDDVNAKQKATYKKLDALSGMAFDKSFGKTMVHDHQETIALFKKEAQMGGNGELKKFATDTLPTLREHFAMTKDLPK